VYKVPPCSENAKCTLMQHSTQQTKHLLTLIVIQASALPGLSHVIARDREWTELLS